MGFPITFNCRKRAKSIERANTLGWNFFFVRISKKKCYLFNFSWARVHRLMLSLEFMTLLSFNANKQQQPLPTRYALKHIRCLRTFVTRQISTEYNNIAASWIVFAFQRAVFVYFTSNYIILSKTNKNSRENNNNNNPTLTSKIILWL